MINNSIIREINDTAKKITGDAIDSVGDSLVDMILKLKKLY